MTTDSAEYNPLDYDNLTVNLVRELMARGPFALPPVESFRGAGVYAHRMRETHRAMIAADAATI